MSITRLELTGFSVFREASFRFASGVNVFLGANATGKTHALKVLYATLRAAQAGGSPLSLGARLQDKLAQVFRPDGLEIGRLGHRQRGHQHFSVRVEATGKQAIDYSIYTKTSKVTVKEQTLKKPPTCIFVPSREALAMYEGFAAAYKARELSFDETYFDLAIALSANAIRGPKAGLQDLVEKLEERIGGKIVLEGERFYVRSATGGRMEAHLVSEGDRKLGSIVRLIANGELREKGVLFWDEPEANLNPNLAVVVAEALITLAKLGVQVVVSTHDYLVSETLGLRQSRKDSPPMRFFSFTRDEDHKGVVVTSADDLDALDANPIRAEFMRHYDRVRGVVE